MLQWAMHFNGWGSIPPYSSIATNWKQKTLCSYKIDKKLNLVVEFI